MSNKVQDKILAVKTRKGKPDFTSFPPQFLF